MLKDGNERFCFEAVLKRYSGLGLAMQHRGENGNRLSRGEEKRLTNDLEASAGFELNGWRGVRKARAEHSEKKRC